MMHTTSRGVVERVNADVAAPAGLLRVSGTPCDVVAPTTWHLALRMLDEPEAALQGVARQGYLVNAPLAVPQLAPCASSGRTWWPRATLHFQGAPRPLRSPSGARAKSRPFCCL